MHVCIYPTDYPRIFHLHFFGRERSCEKSCVHINGTLPQYSKSQMRGYGFPPRSCYFQAATA